MNNIYKFHKFFSELSIDNLLNYSDLQQIVLKSGLNNEILNEQPQEFNSYFGTGYQLKIWQYPNQFVLYLLFLSKYAHKINSYLEIGCRHGGTFIFTNEFLNSIKHNNSIKSIACDIIEIPNNLKNYTEINDNARYVMCNSKSIGFKELIHNQYFSLVLVDGDHSYTAVKNDTELVIDKANIIVLHDIVSEACPGVVKYWKEFTQIYKSNFIFYEFVDQYDSVNGSFLGIGCAVRKEFATV